MKPRRKKELRAAAVTGNWPSGMAPVVTECLDYIDRLERLIGSITGQAYSAGSIAGYSSGYADGQHDAKMKRR